MDKLLTWLWMDMEHQHETVSGKANKKKKTLSKQGLAIDYVASGFKNKLNWEMHTT